jgi:hypothetical protein
MGFVEAYKGYGIKEVPTVSGGTVYHIVSPELHEGTTNCFTLAEARQEVDFAINPPHKGGY